MKALKQLCQCSDFSFSIERFLANKIHAQAIIDAFFWVPLEFLIAQTYTSLFLNDVMRPSLGGDGVDVIQSHALFHLRNLKFWHAQFFHRIGGVKRAVQQTRRSNPRKRSPVKPRSEVNQGNHKADLQTRECFETLASSLSMLAWSRKLLKGLNELAWRILPMWKEWAVG